MTSHSASFFVRHRAFIIILLAWTAVFCGVRILQHGSFQTNAYDLSIYDYMLWSTIHGDFMAEPFHGYWGTHFAIHFQPVLLLLLPIYYIFPGPILLLVLQVFAGAAAAFLLYLIAGRIFQGGRTPLLIGSIFLLFRPFLNAVLYDFHPETFFPGLIFGAYYALAFKKNKGLFLVCLALTLMLKEDAAIFAFFFCVYMFLTQRTQRVACAAGAIAAALYFVVTVQFLIPFFRAKAGLPGSFEFSVLWVGEGMDVLTLARYILLHPVVLLKTIQWSTAGRALLKVLASLLFLPLFSPVVLLAVPPVLILAASKSEVMQGLGLHYFSGILPFLFLSFVFGLKHADGFFRRKGTFAKAGTIALVLVLLVNIANFKWNYLKPGRYANLGEYRSVKRCIALIPKEASLAASSALIPHIPKRKNIYMLTDPREPDFILVHARVTPWPMTAETYREYLRKLDAGNTYQPVVASGNIKLYRKTSGPGG